MYGRNLTKIPLVFRNINRGYFICGGNRLTSLEGCPEKVRRYFNCNNNKLTSFEYCPKYIGGDFNCGHNSITSFDHCPESIGGIFYCNNNPIYHLWKLFGNYNKIELFNDYDIIRGDSIVLDRLNSFLMDIDKPTVEKVEYYKII